MVASARVISGRRGGATSDVSAIVTGFERIERGTHILGEALQLIFEPAEHLGRVAVGFVHLLVCQLLRFGPPRFALHLGIGEHAITACPLPSPTARPWTPPCKSVPIDTRYLK